MEIFYIAFIVVLIQNSTPFHMLMDYIFLIPGNLLEELLICDMCATSWVALFYSMIYSNDFFSIKTFGLIAITAILSRVIKKTIS